MGKIFGQPWIDGDVPTRQRMNWKNEIIDTGANIAALDYVTNLISRYAFNNNGLDSYGSNNATLTAVSFVNGVYGLGASFNGSTSKGDVTDSSSLHVSSKLTVSMWINFQSLSAGQRILNKYAASPLNGFNIDISGSNLRFEVLNGGTDDMLTYPISNFVTGTWYHIVFVWQTGANGQKIYVNGVQVAQQTPTNGSIGANTNDLFIGVDRDGSSAPWTGYLDHVQIFNDALTLSAIQQMYSDCHGGMKAICTVSGSGFTTNAEYVRDVENTVWYAANDAAAIYGNGSDGVLDVLSGTVTATRTMNYKSLMIESGATFNTAGFTINTWFFGNRGALTDLTNGGAAGSGGVTGSTVGNGAAGSGGVSANISGAGAGGGGGGGGECDDNIYAGGTGGNGGKGGGVITLNALRFSNNGTISANGGNGQNGTSGGSSFAGGGGGGAAGAGGTVNITVRELYTTVGATAAAGASGTGGGHGSGAPSTNRNGGNSGAGGNNFSGSGAGAAVTGTTGTVNGNNATAANAAGSGGAGGGCTPSVAANGGNAGTSQNGTVNITYS